MGGNFKFQVQDSFLEYLFWEIWRFKKRIALSEKKPPLRNANSSWDLYPENHSFLMLIHGLPNNTASSIYLKEKLHAR